MLGVCWESLFFSAKMKFLLFATLLIGAYAAPYDASIMTEWNEYKAEHGKHYDTVEEDNRRLEMYLATKKTVQEHNLRHEQGLTSFTMGINQFADWYPEEISKFNGLRVDKNRPKGNLFRLEPGKKVPDSMNWVTQGAVTSVKDQGRCYSSYAFTAVGALEGLMFRTNKSIQSLSAQELVDCTDTYGNGGCVGGYVENSFLYVRDRGGIDSEQSYRYIAKEGMCRADAGIIVASCADYTEIQSGCESALQEAVGTVGPVSIAFAVDDSFHNYKGGIFDGPCGLLPNHGMLVVGYGTDKATGKDYWLVKNSWGKSWGEKGYARIIRGKNKCAIATFGSYPTY